MKKGTVCGTTKRRYCHNDSSFCTSMFGYINV